MADIKERGKGKNTVLFYSCSKSLYVKENGLNLAEVSKPNWKLFTPRGNDNPTGALSSACQLAGRRTRRRGDLGTRGLGAAVKEGGRGG